MQKFAKYGDIPKCSKPKFPQIPAKAKKVRKTRNRKQNLASKSKCEQNQAKDMRRGKCDLGVMWECDEGKQ